MLQHGTDEQRWRAARELGLGEAGVGPLARALGVETNLRIREVICTSLARFGTAEGVEAILPELRSDDASRRASALDALRAIPHAVQPKLTALLEDSDRDVRLLACDLARALPAAAASPLMCGVLDRETDINVCAAAIEVLAEIGQPEAAVAIARCATRFPDVPFLAFSAKAAISRIDAEHGPGHG